MEYYCKTMEDIWLSIVLHLTDITHVTNFMCVCKMYHAIVLDSVVLLTSIEREHKIKLSSIVKFKKLEMVHDSIFIYVDDIIKMPLIRKCHLYLGKYNGWSVYDKIAKRIEEVLSIVPIFEVTITADVLFAFSYDSIANQYHHYYEPLRIELNNGCIIVTGPENNKYHGLISNILKV